MNFIRVMNLKNASAVVGINLGMLSVLVLYCCLGTHNLGIFLLKNFWSLPALFGYTYGHNNKDI